MNFIQVTWGILLPVSNCPSSYSHNIISVIRNFFQKLTTNPISDNLSLPKAKVYCRSECKSRSPVRSLTPGDEAYDNEWKATMSYTSIPLCSRQSAEQRWKMSFVVAMPIKGGEKAKEQIFRLFLKLPSLRPFRYEMLSIDEAKII